MTSSEFKQLQLRPGPPWSRSLHASFFTEDYSDRTLLWGYDVDRCGFHVFLKNEMVHLLRYIGSSEVELIHEFADFSDLYPNKRIYPEASDFEFCKFLRDEGVSLSFTSWNDQRTPKQFHGPTRPGDPTPWVSP